MKLSNKVEAVLNKQINAEFWSAYLYLSMSAWFQEKGLKGFAHWMYIQYQEENTHAIKFFNYVLDRQGSVKLEPIMAVPNEWPNITNVMEEVYKHECIVTGLIYNCYDVAEAEKDRATMSMLQWYVDEQKEEEANADDIINQLKLIGNDGQAIYHLDKELATRIFVDSTLTTAP
jgi:ferritin